MRVVSTRNRGNRSMYYIVDPQGHRHRIARTVYTWIKHHPPATPAKQMSRVLKGQSVTLPRTTRVKSLKYKAGTRTRRFPHRVSAGPLPALQGRTKSSTPRLESRQRITLAQFFKHVLPIVPRCNAKLSCSIPTSRVKVLLKVLRVPIPHGPKGRASVKGVLPPHLEQPCTQLALALGVASLPTRRVGKHKYNAIRFMRPVRVLGSGVAGIVFELADRSVLKLAAIRNRPIAPRIDPIHPSEFLHEVRMMRHAARVLAKTRTHVPHYRAHRVIGAHRSGPDVGVIHMDTAPGKVLRAATYFTEKKRAEKLAVALADIHNAGMIHGDLHTGNAMLDRRGRMTILDWSRAQTVSWFRKRKLLPMYRQLLARDIAFAAQSAASPRDASVVQAFFRSYLKQCRSCVPQSTMHEIMLDPYGYYKPRAYDIFSMLDLVEEDML